MDLRADTTINGQKILHEGNHGNMRYPHKYLIPFNSPLLSQKITSGSTPYLKIFSYSIPKTTNRKVYEIGFKVTNVLGYDWGTTSAWDFFLQILFSSSSITPIYCNLYARDITNCGASSSISHYVIVRDDGNGNYIFDVYFNMRENYNQMHIYPLFTNQDKMLDCFLTDEVGTSSTDFNTIKSSAYMSVQSVYDTLTRGQIYAKGNIVAEGVICPKSGTTSARQAIDTNTLNIGGMYYDNTLNKPLWVKSKSPTVWVDATGTVVP